MTAKIFYMRPMMNRIMLLNLNLLLTFFFISDLIQISSTVFKYCDMMAVDQKSHGKNDYCEKYLEVNI